MSFERGQTVNASTIVKNSAGTLTNSPTVVLTVTSPAGTVTTPTVTNTGAGGLYTAPVPVADVAASEGIWRLRWVASGTVTAVYSDLFTVRDPGVWLISLGDAKKQLNITSTTDDLELEDYIDTLTAVVEHITGPMIRRTVVETLWVCGPEIVLGTAPVISLTSVVAAQTGWIAPPVGDLFVDPSTGIVRWLAGGAGTYGLTYGLMTFTYVAGRALVPASVQLAARIILAHMWETQRGGGGASPDALSQGGDLFVPGAGFSVPHRAVELLESYRRAPAVA